MDSAGNPWDVSGRPWEQSGTQRLQVVRQLNAFEQDTEAAYTPDLESKKSGRARHRTIEFFRPRVPATGPARPDLTTQPERDLYTLAHEYGHALSDKRELRSEAHGAAVDQPRGAWPSMPEAARRLIYEEEERAWQVGREMLASLGLDDFAGYDQRTAESLGFYQVRLGFKSSSGRDSVGGLRSWARRQAMWAVLT